MKILLIILLLLLQGCKEIPEQVHSSTVPSNCEMIEETLILRNQTVKLPTFGRFVLESHLATNNESFSKGSFPSTVTEKIEGHLNSSCDFLKMMGYAVSPECKNVYTSRYHREWTPPEGGKAGQGSVGNLKPALTDEMFSGNMYWKVKPKPGTKFLACNGADCVIVIVGYETGPLDSKYLGGLQGEVMWLLNASNTNLIRWGRLKDQSLSPGKITCK